MHDNEEIKGNEGGTVHISDEVVASIAALTAADVEGVASLSAGVDFAELIGRRNLAKGVKIAIQDHSVMLDISLLVRYSYPIPAVAAKVQKKVKEAVESMTGMTVIEINIHVFGVSFDKESKKKFRS